ncbi:MAG: hypothetical protein SFU86_05625 [Pirellulaceae bacterium]|nr:hypothetical protein [Pirellulaceae bacterium]
MLAISWLLIVAFEPNGGPRLYEYIVIGYLLGTLFAQTTLASAWVALGPGTIQWRLSASVVWLLALVTAFGVSIAIHSGPDDVALTVALCLAGQWIGVQIPLWIMTLAWGLSIRAGEAEPSGRPLQFGIRQLMILTAIVAVLFGAGRVVVAQLIAEAPDRTLGGGEALVFAFLAVAAVVLMLPLIVATLVPRFAWLATLAITVLIGLATAWEVSLLSALSLGGPDQWHFASINAFSVFWILAILSLVRLAGFGLARR